MTVPSPIKLKGLNDIFDNQDSTVMTGEHIAVELCRGDHNQWQVVVPSSTGGYRAEGRSIRQALLNMIVVLFKAMYGGGFISGTRPSIVFTSISRKQNEINELQDQLYKSKEEVQQWKDSALKRLGDYTEAVQKHDALRRNMFVIERIARDAEVDENPENLMPRLEKIRMKALEVLS